MPVYEYECPKCTKIEELNIKLDETPIKPPTCKKCKKKMIRIISLCSFSLKGKGWCRDGYNK